MWVIEHVRRSVREMLDFSCNFAILASFLRACQRASEWSSPQYPVHLWVERWSWSLWGSCWSWSYYHCYKWSWLWFSSISLSKIKLLSHARMPGTYNQADMDFAFAGHHRMLSCKFVLSSTDRCVPALRTLNHSNTTCSHMFVLVSSARISLPYDAILY